MKNKILSALAVLLLVCVIATSFTACKEEKFELSFIVGGELYDVVTAVGKVTVSLPTDPSKEGYTFEGWFLDDGIWDKPFDENTLLNEAVPNKLHIYAKFVQNEEPKTYAKVVILSGQSNMFGSGKVADITKDSVGQKRYDKLSNPINNVKILMSEGDSLDDFKPIRLGVGHVWEYGFGPELGVAEYFAEKYPDETVYVIKYALSGTRLWDTWVSPSRTDREVAEAYNTLIKIVDSGLKILTDADIIPQIIGFCWMQGESDTVIEEAAFNYYANQSALAKDLRERYNEYSVDNCMNFVDAKIGPYWAYGGDVVNDAKLRFSNDDAKHNFLLDTRAPNLVKEGVDGLTRLEDDIHYDSISVLKLGQMFAEQMDEATKTA